MRTTTLLKSYLIQLPNGREIVVYNPDAYSDAVVLAVYENPVVVIDAIKE